MKESKQANKRLFIALKYCLFVLIVAAIVLVSQIHFLLNNNTTEIFSKVKDLSEVEKAKYASVKGLEQGSLKAQFRQKMAVEKFKLPLEVKAEKSGVVFRLIPNGSFLRGKGGLDCIYWDKTGNKIEWRPSDSNKVIFKQPFYISKFEITQKQWETVINYKVITNPFKEDGKGSNLPDVNKTWNDCQVFCDILCKLEGVPPGTYSLPTEAQWEYACRAGTNSFFCYKGKIEKRLLNYDNPKCFAVGSFQPNAWGIYDMHGNVWEWCQDNWCNQYPEETLTNPINRKTSSYRVIRGGAYSTTVACCSSLFRRKGEPNNSSSAIGFRIVRNLTKGLQK